MATYAAADPGADRKRKAIQRLKAAQMAAELLHQATQQRAGCGGLADAGEARVAARAGRVLGPDAGAGRSCRAGRAGRGRDTILRGPQDYPAGFPGHPESRCGPESEQRRPGELPCRTWAAAAWASARRGTSRRAARTSSRRRTCRRGQGCRASRTSAGW
jgi:hypothetical protein